MERGSSGVQARTIAWLIVLALAAPICAQGRFYFVRATDSAEREGYRWISVGIFGESATLVGSDIFSQVPGEAPVQLTDHKSSSQLGGGVYGLAPSPGGRYIVFRSNQKGSNSYKVDKNLPGGIPNDLFLLDTASRSIRKLASAELCGPYAWSPNGRRLAVELDYPAEKKILLYTASTGNRGVLTLPHRSTSWSWDGKGRIIMAFASRSGADFRVLGQASSIGRVRFRGIRDQKSAGNGDVRNGTPVSFSPHGAFEAVLLDEKLTIGRGFRFRDITSRGFDLLAEAVPFWSPDGRLLCVESAGPTGKFDDPSHPDRTMIGPDSSNAVLVYQGADLKRPVLVADWIEENYFDQSKLVLGWYDNSSVLLLEQAHRQQEVWRYFLGRGREEVEIFPDNVSEVVWCRGNGDQAQSHEMPSFRAQRNETGAPTTQAIRKTSK